ncbi:hypothetical protein HK414_24705 [Ramlibacter terrae]|uniref:Uncharacterized protein n=1 Tax=Ramlibacter terrae TaxID=2732511 RepID=A0ABX6P5Q8_9BURK|nr:hypothetical protein HK414_24705 [Ramlibacter terrae]
MQRSPWTYVYDFKLAHDLAVTVNRDPADTRGFPASATQYQLTASCDNATPVQSGWLPLSSTQQQQDALTYTFPGLPAGGKVIVNAAFMGADSSLVGAGSTGPVDNTLPTAALTITESLVALTAATRYAHRQKLALDTNGNHVWTDTTQAPAAPSPNCGSGSGNLCELVGITVCEPFAAVGYTWRASSSTVQGFGSGDSGQLYQFASVSTRADPQRGYMFSRGGFSGTTRLAFDPTSATSNSFYIDPASGDNIVRQSA